MNNLPVTASATYASLLENEKRFQLKIERIRSSYRTGRFYLKYEDMPDWLRGVPKHRALVRHADVPTLSTGV